MPHRLRKRKRNENDGPQNTRSRMLVFEENRATNTMLAPLIYYVVTISFGYMSFEQIKSQWQYRDLLCELMSSFVMVAVSTENFFIMMYYGTWSYLIVTFVLSQILSMLYPIGFSPNPCEYFARYLHGELQIFKLLRAVLLQMIGGLFAARVYAQTWYSMHPTVFHSAKLYNGGSTEARFCSPLQVSIVSGFVLEFLGSLIPGTFSLCLLQLHRIEKTEKSKNKVWLIYGLLQLCKLVTSMALLIYAYDLTGMYANPINVSSQTIWCDNTHLFGHFVVYWMAPITSTFILHHPLIQLSYSSIKQI